MSASNRLNSLNSDTSCLNDKTQMIRKTIEGRRAIGTKIQKMNNVS